MVSKKTTVVNADGFHMRAAGDFVNEMAKFKSSHYDFFRRQNRQREEHYETDGGSLEARCRVGN